MSVKSIIREITPPFLWHLAKQVIQPKNTDPVNRNGEAKTQHEFEWASPTQSRQPIGYVESSLIEFPTHMFPEIMSVIEGPQPYGCKLGELQGESMLYWHQQAFPFAYAIGRCLPLEHPLKILDWGGGLGVYRHLTRTLYPDLSIEYHIHELPEFSKRGADFTPDAHFHSVSSEWENDRFDLVMASGALQYAPDWKRLLKQLADVTGRWMYLSRIPILLQETEPRVVLHRYRAFGNENDVLFHIFSRSGLLQTIESLGLRLVREFIGAEEIVVHPDGHRIPFRGYLLQKV